MAQSFVEKVRAKYKAKERKVPKLADASIMTRTDLGREGSGRSRLS